MKRFTKTPKTILKGAAAGFTVLELVVVIGIAAVLLAVAIPTTMNWLRNRGVRDAADQLAMDLQRAKLLAIQRHSNCSVTIRTPAANQYSFSLTNEVVELPSHLGSVVFSDAPNVSAPVITFTPQGICQVFGAIFLSDGQNRYRVRTTAAGAVSIHLDSDGQWT